MTLDAISKDLCVREQQKVLPKQITVAREALPVYQYRQQIIDVIEKNPVVMVKGATGSGKSTQVSTVPTNIYRLTSMFQVCQFLLEAYIRDGRGANCNVCYKPL